MEKELINFDDIDCYLIIGFSHEQRSEAVKFEHEETGEDVLTEEDLEPVMVRKYEKDGDDFFDWTGKKECESCGRDFPEPFPAFLIRF